MTHTSNLEATLAMELSAMGIHYEREYRFSPTRRWRADYLIRVPQEDTQAHTDEPRPARDILVEVQGGLYSQGRHNRGAAMEKEYVKLAEAQLLGYMVLQFGPNQVRSGEAAHTIRRALEGKE